MSACLRRAQRALVLLAALAGAAPVAASAFAEATPLARLELATRLAAEGRAQGDPLLLLAAARLRHGIDLVPQAGTAPAGWLAEGLPDWPELLEAARDAAAGDAALLAVIAATGEDLAAEAGRGVVTGQVYAIARLEPGASDIYPPLLFAAGDYAEVYVEAEADTSLSLRVFDSAGQVVCADTDPLPVAYCGWRPAEAGHFTIRIDNSGEAATGYALMTN